MNIAIHLNMMAKLRKDHNKEKQFLFDILKHAKVKLEIYRDHSDGVYHGGLEHTALIEMIDRAFKIIPFRTQPKKEPIRYGYDPHTFQMSLPFSILSERQ